MVTESESQLRRRRLPVVDRRQIRLMVFAEHLRVRDVAAVAIDLPRFGKSAQRDTGVILDNNAAAAQEEIAHAGEALGMHQVGGGLEQAVTLSLPGAPLEERTRSAGKVGLEVIQGLLGAVAGEVDLHAFRGSLHVGGVED